MGVLNSDANQSRFYGAVGMGVKDFEPNQHSKNGWTHFSFAKREFMCFAS